jgi:uncharacterized metal-binding protein YceD (DUF177 family)
MIIDLQNVTEETHVHEVLDRDWWQMTDPSQQVLGFGSPIEVDVKVSKAADKFLVDGTLKGRVKVRCDRCLEPFDLEVKSKFNVYLAVNPSGPSDEDIELLDEEMEVEPRSVLVQERDWARGFFQARDTKVPRRIRWLYRRERNRSQEET